MNDDHGNDEDDRAVLGVAMVFGLLTAGFLIAAIVSSPFDKPEKLLLLAIVVAGVGAGLAGLVRRVG